MLLQKEKTKSFHSRETQETISFDEQGREERTCKISVGPDPILSNSHEHYQSVSSTSSSLTHSTTKQNEDRAAEDLEGVEANDEELERLRLKDLKIIRWYVISPKNFLPQMWEFLLNQITIYTFVSVPLV